MKLSQFSLSIGPPPVNKVFSSSTVTLSCMAALLATLATPVPGIAQTTLFTYKTSYSDFDFKDVAKTFVTTGGDLAQVVRDRFSGTGGLGAEMMHLSESGRASFNFGAEYKSSNLFGSGGFRIRYSPTSQRPDFSNATETTVKDQTAYFRSTVGFGINLLPKTRVFFYINPNIDVQYGQRVFLEDAYAAFQAKGFSDPGDFKVENGLLLGGVARAHIGLWLSDDLALTLSPAAAWSHRFVESYQGLNYNGVSSSGRAFGYDFSFGLSQRIAGIR